MSQANGAAYTVKQACIQLLLEQGDALADRRLGQMQAIGGGAERRCVGNGKKRLQTINLQGLPPWELPPFLIPLVYGNHNKYELFLSQSGR